MCKQDVITHEGQSNRQRHVQVEREEEKKHGAKKRAKEAQKWELQKPEKTG